MRALVPTAALVLALAGVLGGCDRTRIYNTTVMQAYNPSAFGYAAGRRDLATIIRGDPFDIGEARFTEAVLDSLARHQPPPQPTNFTTEPGESAREGYRVLFLFDAPPAVNSLRICEQPLDVPVVETGDVVRVKAAFCHFGRLFTATTGEVAGVEGVDDPAFDTLIGQVVTTLFPPFDPNEDDDDPIIIPGAADDEAPGRVSLGPGGG